jgi:hypothetical protein
MRRQGINKMKYKEIALVEFEHVVKKYLKKSAKRGGKVSKIS